MGFPPGPPPGTPGGPGWIDTPQGPPPGTPGGIGWTGMPPGPPPGTPGGFGWPPPRSGRPRGPARRSSRSGCARVFGCLFFLIFIAVVVIVGYLVIKKQGG